MSRFRERSRRMALCGVLGMSYIAAEYTAGGALLLAAMAVMGCVVWLLFDSVLTRFTLLYHKKWRRKLFPR